MKPSPVHYELPSIFIRHDKNKNQPRPNSVNSDRSIKNAKGNLGSLSEISLMIDNSKLKSKIEQNSSYL